jgi:hypothetical protein
MDLPVPVDRSPAGSNEDPPTSDPPVVEERMPIEASRVETEPEPGPDDLAAEVAALSRRVDALAGSFEGTVRQAVSEEVQRVAGELQHTVTALGRILVRDLGKLNQILGEHRDTIVAELRRTSTGKAPIAEETLAAVDEATPDEPAGPDDEDPRGADQQGTAGRQWRARRRKA